MYKKVFFLLILLLSLSKTGFGTHIVGGEFEVQYTGFGDRYNIYLNMYYDDINADPGLFDLEPTINVSIFSKSTNLRLKNIILKKVSSDIITYNTNGCNDVNKLRTRTFRYVSLDEKGVQGSVNLAVLNEPGGYYLAWERCCRNYQSLNIVHQNFSGNYISGQTFYLELPPVRVLGNQFINSSPKFVPVPAQYLCKDNPILIDFSATDADGDSLYFSLVTPIRGNTFTGGSNPNPAPAYPTAGPYPLIGWKPGYSALNAIPGNPSLGINPNTGILNVTPNLNGLFAFAVVCEEYRAGVMIGKVIRDFQFLVQDCPISYPPSVGLNPSNTGAGNANWGTSTPDTLLVKIDKDTCYTIFVTDSSANFYNTPDDVNISYGKTNLPPSVITFSPAKVALTPLNDTTSLNMCFSACDKIIYEKDSVYFLDIIVKDGNEGDCNRKTDTLRTYIKIEIDESNVRPIIGTTLDPARSLTVYPDSLASFYVFGTDANAQDIKDITAVPFRFSLSDYDMRFTQVYNDGDSVSYRFEWKPNCGNLIDREAYNIEFILKDNSCLLSHTDSATVVMKIEDAPTELPNIEPANLITPNGDDFNECFYLNNLPADNCTHIFKSVEIYNRWGARVYRSTDRNFQWCPTDQSEGIYYYAVDISTKVIKSWLQILR